MTDWLCDESLAPNTSGTLAPFYDATSRGELALPSCGQCGAVLELEQLRCDACGSIELDWRIVEREGCVHSVTTVHRLEPGLIRSTSPYHIVDVELTSGHRLLVTTERAVEVPPAIGDHVRVTFRNLGGVGIPALALPDSAQEDGR